MIRRVGPNARLALSMAPPKASAPGAARRAWRRVVSALSSAEMAATIVVINLIVSLLVLNILLRTLRALQQATCVMGAAEGLMQCLK